MRNPAVALVGIIMLSASATVAAKSPPEAPRLTVNTGTTMTSLLNNLKGKRIDLHLKSGKTVRGTVAEVGSNVVHLQELSEKDYYDSYIAIKHISGFDVQMRFPPGSY